MPRAEASGLTATPKPEQPVRAHERFRASPHVLSTRSGDTVVLMDRKRATYYTLNDVGGRIWELVSGGATAEQVTDRLLEQYAAPRMTVEQDVAATLGHLLDSNLLERGFPSGLETVERGSRPMPRAVPDGNLKVPSVLECGLLIAWFKGLLRLRGFLNTLAWIRRRIQPVSPIAEAELETVRSVEHIVAMAAALYPGRAKCLEQSLTLYYLLRRQGVAAAYCQGVQSYPFQAHAWVEYRGEVLNDVPEHAKMFSRLPSQLP